VLKEEEVLTEVEEEEKIINTETSRKMLKIKMLNDF
jgi:hypothetical protein